MSTDLRLLYVTTKDLTQAREIARALLERRLIACANILPQMESHYHWKGALEAAHECVLVLKTTAKLTREVTQAVTQLHDYEVPCVLELKVEGGSEPYLSWLRDETISNEA